MGQPNFHYKITAVKNYYNLLLIMTLLACKSNIDSDKSKSDKEDLKSAVQYEMVSLDTVYLEAPNSTFVGYLFLTNRDINFIDRIQSKVFQFDHQGNFKEEFLGRGDGPDRQNGIYGIVSEGDELIVLSDKHISIFDASFKLKDRLNFTLGGQESVEEMLHAPRSDMFGLYEISWISQEVNMPIFPLAKGQGFILPVMMTHPELNGYWTTEYYESVAIFGLFDEKYNLQKLGGKRSEEYLKYNYLPNFDYSYFTTKGDSLLVSFPIDPKIHVYDLGFNFLGTFGEPGIDMKTDYIPTQTLEEAESQWETDRDQFGHYDHIFYDTKEDLLFRSYLPRGNGAKSARFQIYKGNQLAADLEVPIRFRVLGSVDGVFYADGIVDEENEKLAFFKFKLDEK
jgi:hypothetical protein